jgi:hypothetical protein
VGVTLRNVPSNLKFFCETTKPETVSRARGGEGGTC